MAKPNQYKQQYRTHCRCGEPLNYSIYDIVSGRPADGADYWCSNRDPATGPHDWGVVIYQPVLHGVQS